MTTEEWAPSRRRPRSSRWRRAFSRIRLRIVAGFVLVNLAALVIVILVTRQVQLARVDREIEQEQAQEVGELRLLVHDGVDPATGEPLGTDAVRLVEVFLSRNVPSDDEGFYAIVGDATPRQSNGSPPLFDDPQFLSAWRGVTTPTHWSTTSELDGVGEVRSLAVPIRMGTEIVGVFVVASFPDDDQHEVDQVVRVLALAGLAMLVFTAVVAWSAAGRILRPIRDLSSTARSINESDLSARIPVDDHDELAELGTTFNDMVDRLEVGFAQQRRFLDDVAHELRTPITIARGHLEFLGDDPAERAETVAIVTDELDRMGRYVTDLLTLAKTEQPNFLDERPVDIGDLLAEVHQRAQALGARTWELDAAPPPGVLAITADPERLRQALLNLAANAVQHTGTDDVIALGAAASPGELRMWVRDSGPGVDPAIASTVFARFTRGAASRAGRPDGAGIGLSIVDAIARAHRGRVELETGPSGATFSLVLPLDEPIPGAVFPPPIVPAGVDAGPTPDEVP